VRLPWSDGGDAPAATGAGAAARGAAPAQRASGETPRVAREELRTAAAELARGAMGVARSVWDGVAERVASAQGASAAPGADGQPPARSASGGDGSEVLVIQSLEEPDALALGSASAGASPFAAPDAPWRVELRRARDAATALAPAAAGGSAPLATVPVPP